LTATPVQIFGFFLAGRSHFEEARAHLGLNLNVNGHHGRLPLLTALFSIVTLVAHQQLQHPFELPKAAWYQKTLPTFADALALVRQQLWQMQTFQMSSADVDTVKVPRAFSTRC